MLPIRDLSPGADSVHNLCKQGKWCRGMTPKPGNDGITQKTQKFIFCKKMIEYIGFKMSEDGFHPASFTRNAIRQLPKPKSIMGLRAGFGQLEHVSFTFSKSKQMAGF